VSFSPGLNAELVLSGRLLCVAMSMGTSPKAELMAAVNMAINMMAFFFHALN